MGRLTGAAKQQRYRDRQAGKPVSPRKMGPPTKREMEGRQKEAMTEEDVKLEKQRDAQQRLRNRERAEARGELIDAADAIKERGKLAKLSEADQAFFLAFADIDGRSGLQCKYGVPGWRCAAWTGITGACQDDRLCAFHLARVGWLSHCSNTEARGQDVLPSPFMEWQRTMLPGLERPLCGACLNRPLPREVIATSIDRKVTSIMQYGGNQQALCRKCNSRKGDKGQAFLDKANAASDDERIDAGQQHRVQREAKREAEREAQLQEERAWWEEAVREQAWQKDAMREHATRERAQKEAAESRVQELEGRVQELGALLQTKAAWEAVAIESLTQLTLQLADMQLADQGMGAAPWEAAGCPGPEQPELQVTGVVAMTLQVAPVPMQVDLRWYAEDSQQVPGVGWPIPSSQPELDYGI